VKLTLAAMVCAISTLAAAAAAQTTTATLPPAPPPPGAAPAPRAPGAYQPAPWERPVESSRPPRSYEEAAPVTHRRALRSRHRHAVRRHARHHRVSGRHHRHHVVRVCHVRHHHRVCRTR